MCGIVGYIGPKQAAPVLLRGLNKLEYRGYDSAGIAVLDGDSGRIDVRKARGRLSELRALTRDGEDVAGCLGIGHTRWATHGEPNDVNSHPHLSGSGRVALVHNGIIENYAELRAFLAGEGFSFVSDTDTEVVAQLVDYYYKDGVSPEDAVRRAESQLRGSYALEILFFDRPDMFIAIRKDSPLIVGLGSGENFVASDVTALVEHTRRIIRLGEREMAVLTRDRVTVYDHFGMRVTPEISEVTWDISAAEKGGYKHFMLKEIMEQPEAVKNTVSPRLANGRIKLELKYLTDEVIRGINEVYIVACGSSYHVGMVARYAMERLAKLPARVELASEFRYLDPMIGENTLVVIISQSGETLDTLYALREAKARRAHILSIVNVVGSSIAVESEDVLYTWAGPEIAVATTKAYSTQLVMMDLLILYLAGLRGTMSDADIKEKTDSLLALPEAMEKLLSDTTEIQKLASKCFDRRDIFFMGRNIDYALALEGSLKLKEISYIHSEAYAAGELKHGTISLIEPGTLVVALLTGPKLREKMISNIREVKARRATVIAETVEPIAINPDKPNENPDHVITLPDLGELAVPSLSIVPLQLFAYYVALLKGCDIDKPRNLAKSVTVE